MLCIQAKKSHLPALLRGKCTLECIFFSRNSPKGNQFGKPELVKKKPWGQGGSTHGGFFYRYTWSCTFIQSSDPSQIALFFIFWKFGLIVVDFHTGYRVYKKADLQEVDWCWLLKIDPEKCNHNDSPVEMDISWMFSSFSGWYLHFSKNHAGGHVIGYELFIFLTQHSMCLAEKAKIYLYFFFICRNTLS